jgi:hypothetical protein
MSDDLVTARLTVDEHVQFTAQHHVHTARRNRTKHRHSPRRK